MNPENATCSRCGRGRRCGQWPHRDYFDEFRWEQTEGGSAVCPDCLTADEQQLLGIARATSIYEAGQL